MNFTRTIKIGAGVAALAAITFVACHKTTTTPTTNATATTEQSGATNDNAKLESANNDVIAVADAAASTGTSNLRVTSCATVTNDTAVTPHVLTIDFGSGCTGADGRIRSGQIIVTYQGHYKDSGSMHTITYNNYRLDGYKIGGSKSVTNMGTTAGGSLSGAVWYSVIQNDSLWVSADSVATMKGVRTRTWNTGYATPARTDDSYLIAGNDTMTRANGKIYWYAINTPLKVAYGCRHIETGSMTISGSAMAHTWTVTYNDPDCVGTVTLSDGIRTYTITIL